MQEEDTGFFMYHVVVDGNHFNIVFHQRFNNRGHFVFQHGKIPGHCCFFRSTLPGGPGIEAKEGADRGVVLAQIHIRPPDGHLIDPTAHLPLCPRTRAIIAVSSEFSTSVAGPEAGSPPRDSLTLSNTAFTLAASSAPSPIPPMCMYMTLGRFRIKWL